MYIRTVIAILVAPAEFGATTPTPILRCRFEEVDLQS